MKYLVLGSAGQIGGHLSEFLQKQGHTVLGFDIVTSPDEDLRKPSKLLLDRMQQADFVMFLAFDVGGARYLKTYQHTFEFISNNVKLMDTTFDALKQTRKPFIFMSSQMSNMSYSSYGVLKALGEYYTRALNGLVVKFWNVYGFEKDPEKWHAISDFIRKAQTLGRVEMMTDGREQRQFLYADDCCKALHLLSRPDTYATMPRDANLHVTSFEWSSILQVALHVGDMMGVPVVPGKSSDTVQKDLRNEPDRFVLKYWQPATSLRAGIAHVIKAMAGK